MTKGNRAIEGRTLGVQWSIVIKIDAQREETERMKYGANLESRHGGAKVEIARRPRGN